MFSTHRLLFLALKKVRIVEITPPHVLITWSKNQQRVWETTDVLGEKEQYFYSETYVVSTCKYIANQITRPIYWTTYCIFLFSSIQHFGKLGVNLNGLVVKMLDSQSRSPMFKTIGWLQGRVSLSSLRGR